MNKRRLEHTIAILLAAVLAAACILEHNPVRTAFAARDTAAEDLTEEPFTDDESESPQEEDQDGENSTETAEYASDVYEEADKEEDNDKDESVEETIEKIKEDAGMQKDEEAESAPAQTISTGTKEEEYKEEQDSVFLTAGAAADLLDGGSDEKVLQSDEGSAGQNEDQDEAVESENEEGESDAQDNQDQEEAEAEADGDDESEEGPDPDDIGSAVQESPAEDEEIERISSDADDDQKTDEAAADDEEDEDTGDTGKEDEDIEDEGEDTKKALEKLPALPGIKLLNAQDAGTEDGGGTDDAGEAEDSDDDTIETQDDGGGTDSSDEGPYAGYESAGYTTKTGVVKHVNWESNWLRNEKPEDYLFLAREWSSFFDTVDYMHPANGHADSAYSFTITPSESSELEWWNESGSENVIVNWMSRLGHEHDIQFWQALGIVLEDPGMSEHCGVWVRNAGIYEGEQTDVKITFKFSSFTAPSSYDADDELTIYPIVMISLRKDGMLGVDTEDLGLELIFEMFKSDGITPLSPDMSLNFGDIDGNQTYGFRVLDGSRKKPLVANSVVKDGKILYYGCRVNARADIARQDREAAYRKFMDEETFNYCKNYIWLVAPYNINYDTEPFAEGEVRFELSKVHCFSIIYASWMEYCYQGLRDNRGLVNEEGVGATYCFNDSYRRYELVKQMIVNGAYDQGTLEKEPVGTDSNLYRANLSYFTSYAFLPYDLPKPSKTVSDTDEISVTSNTLSGTGEEFTYEITQFIPLERPEYYYDMYSLTDTLPDGVEYVDCKVKNSADSADKTSWFNVSRDGQTITITAGGEGSSVTKNQSFYNTTFTFSITVKLSDKIKQSEGTFTFTNKAASHVYRRVLADRLSDASDPANYVDDNLSEDTNEVTTVIVIVRPKIKITKEIDEKYAPFGSPAFLFRLVGKTTGRTYYTCIQLDGEKLSGSQEIFVEVGASGTETYTVEELKVLRYTLCDISLGECQNAKVAKAEDGLSADVTVYAASGANAAVSCAEVKFKDRLTYWEKLSHMDSVINSVSTSLESAE